MTRAAVLAGLAALALPAAAQADTYGAVGGVRDPAAGVLDLSVEAVETEGAGVRSATALLEGNPIDTAYFADAGCVPGECPSVGSVALAVPTTAVPDGARRLEVTVEDANGTVTHLLDQTITIVNTPVTSNPTVIVRVGGGASAPRPGPPKPPGPGPGPGPDRSDCFWPRLSVFLAQPPLRFHRGVPVLAAGRRYPFRGRLTCLVNGRRRAATRGTLVEVRNRIRGRTIQRGAARVRREGRILVKLAHRRSCTVVFRVRGAGGRLVRVRIPIRVRRAPS